MSYALGQPPEEGEPIPMIQAMRRSPTWFGGPKTVPMAPRGGGVRMRSVRPARIGFRSMFGMGDEVDTTPPAPGPLNWQMMLMWGGLVATGLGIFWLTTTQKGQQQLRANRRRSSRRRTTRRNPKLVGNAKRRRASSVRYVNTPRDWDRERNKPANWNKRIYYGPRDHFPPGHSRPWYVESPNGSQLFYSKAEATRIAKSLSKRYGLRTKQMKWTERQSVRRRKS